MITILYHGTALKNGVRIQRVLFVFKGGSNEKQAVPVCFVIGKKRF